MIESESQQLKFKNILSKNNTDNIQKICKIVKAQFAHRVKPQYDGGQYYIQNEVVFGF